MTLTAALELAGTGRQLRAPAWRTLAQGVRKETGAALRELQVDHGEAVRQLAALQDAHQRAQRSLQVGRPSPSRALRLTLNDHNETWCGAFSIAAGPLLRPFHLTLHSDRDSDYTGSEATHTFCRTAVSAKRPA